MYYVIVAGPAGSGKSTLVKALSEWIEDSQMSVVKVNFDPAAESLPYVPDVDVRRYIRTYDLMIEKGLGPNGALVASVDMLINYIEDIRQEIGEVRANYALIDLPGQLEVVAFRRLGPQIIRELTRGYKSAMLFLIDSRLASTPSSAFSLLLLSLSTLYRMQLPQILVINKIDLLLGERKEVEESTISRLVNELYLLKMLDEDYSCYEIPPVTPLVDYEAIVKLCESLKQVYSDVIPISAKDEVNIDLLYGAIQKIVAGGEDYLTEEPSGKL